MKTFSAKPAEVEKKWILIDAEGMVVGRLAAYIANHLRGKHLPTFTPHVDCGDNVIVVNADKDRASPATSATTRNITGTPVYPGGVKQRTARKQVLEGRFPERVRGKSGAADDAQAVPLARQTAQEPAGLCRPRTHPHEAQSARNWST